MSQTITLADLARRLGVSRMTLHRMRKGGELPPPIQTTRRLVRFSASDVDLWFDLGCPVAADFRALKRTRQQFAGKRGAR